MKDHEGARHLSGSVRGSSLHHKSCSLRGFNQIPAQYVSFILFPKCEAKVESAGNLSDGSVKFLTEYISAIPIQCCDVGSLTRDGSGWGGGRR